MPTKQLTFPITMPIAFEFGSFQERLLRIKAVHYRWRSRNTFPFVKFLKPASNAFAQPCFRGFNLNLMACF
jgi:hypothetical protein